MNNPLADLFICQTFSAKLEKSKFAKHSPHQTFLLYGIPVAMYKGAVVRSYIIPKLATVVNMHVQIEDCSLVTTFKIQSFSGNNLFLPIEVQFGLTINQILWLTWYNA